jgi:lysophospholipase L1-like esterase
MYRQRLRFALPAILALGLCASLALNVVLYRQADGDYRELNAVRLDPLGLSAYEAVPAPARASERRVVLFGDSRAQDWPAPAVSGTEFVNRGVGAQTSAQALGRLGQHILSLQPDVVVVQMCINDLKAIGLFPDAEDAIVEACLRNLRTTVDAIRAGGAEVVLTTVIPASGDVPLARRLVWSPRVNDAVRRVNDAIRGWEGHGMRVLDAAAILSDERGQLRREYAADLLHLNAGGYRVLNDALQDLLVHSDVPLSIN